MLEAKEVVKSFDGFRALDSATLTVPKGTVYGWLAPTAPESPPSSATLPAYTAPTAANCCWRRSHLGEHRRQAAHGGDPR